MQVKLSTMAMLLGVVLAAPQIASAAPTLPTAFCRVRIAGSSPEVTECLGSLRTFSLLSTDGSKYAKFYMVRNNMPLHDGSPSNYTVRHFKARTSTGSYSCEVDPNDDDMVQLFNVALVMSPDTPFTIMYGADGVCQLLNIDHTSARLPD